MVGADWLLIFGESIVVVALFIWAFFIGYRNLGKAPVKKRK